MATRSPSLSTCCRRRVSPCVPCGSWGECGIAQHKASGASLSHLISVDIMVSLPALLCCSIVIRCPSWTASCFHYMFVCSLYLTTYYKVYMSCLSQELTIRKGLKCTRMCGESRQAGEHGPKAEPPCLSIKARPLNLCGAAGVGLSV